MKKNIIAIAGGGHAGIEAALALSRMKIYSILITMDKKAIGRMSCNPAIGGLAKGHLVREIDALGGIMSLAADNTCIQYKTLNLSKGRAVWSPRAQVDKIKYSNFVSNVIKKSRYINIVEDEVVDIIVDKDTITGIISRRGLTIKVNSLIVTSGTFMNGTMHIGKKQFKGGRFGEKRSSGLTESLTSMGFLFSRLKTGTPPRVEAQSIDFKKTTPSKGDDIIYPFSIMTNPNKVNNDTLCYFTSTNKNSHEEIQNKIHHSAMFSGQINAVGPRYCPSIEDKIFRYPDRPSHQIFLEPEWKNSNQIYVNGFSTSLPEKVQIKALKTIKGLENVELIRPGYAIEYDQILSHQLKSSLESKSIGGLFFAGQINGTSGYEEAASQGLIAGINAGLRFKKQPSFVLSRSESYIGVLIDDLITKTIKEPYRMFTSSAEYRLFLRQDNADLRLTPKAIDLNLIFPKHKKIFNAFCKSTKQLGNLLKKSKIKINGSTLSAEEHLKKPTSEITKLKNLPLSQFDQKTLFSIETKIKYSGYIEIERKRIKKIKSLEKAFIPTNIVYSKIKNLSNEAVEKLSLVRPETLGQASRIAGVRQADLAILSVVVYKHKQA